MCDYLCYLLLRHDGNATYVGCTNNMSRRIRQHNCEISGGAKYTSMWPGQWSVQTTVVGFVSRNEALSFEWHWKRESRKFKGTPLERRLAGLKNLLQQPRWKHVTPRPVGTFAHN
jgi:predicted GIY-YIG superfamily endonuclease